MTSPKQPMEAYTARRTKLIDADKVRYRVYKTPQDFVAVIAENALMAVRVSGIKEPYKIVRDMPVEQASIEAHQLSPVDSDALPLSFALTPRELETEHGVEMTALMQDPKETPFIPIDLADLERKKPAAARILPPDLLLEIIENYQDAALPLEPSQTPLPAAETQPPEASDPVEHALTTPPQALSPAELLALAETTLPPTSDMPVPDVEVSAAETPVLSPEEVEKLLHGS